MIRDLLGKNAHTEILSTELWAITELTVPAEITNLTDLSHFVGLKTLNLQNSAAADFTVLADLPALTSLDVTGSQLGSEGVAAIGSIPTLMELHIMNRKLALLLAERGIHVHDMEVNSYVTTQEMAGASVTLLKLDDELRQYYDAPCSSPYYKKQRKER